MKKIPDIIKLARRKLKDNQTGAEKIVWNKVRAKRLWVKFQQQFPLYVYTENSGLDRYIIPDFYCSEKKLIIEIDWNIHDRKDVYQLDTYKEKLLQEQGYKIIRYLNQEILDSWNNIWIRIKSDINSLQPLALKKSEDSGESLQPANSRQKLQQKRFTMRNESFTCENCDREIIKHPSWSARNHCPHCLCSKHLDKDFPWDRASECLWLMKPVWKDHKKNKGWMIAHECQKCSKKILNKIAEDDSIEVFGKL